MIINPSEDLLNLYACKKGIMEYLVYKCGIPILCVEDDHYLFIRDNKLEEALNKMPILLKISEFLSPLNK